jgi:hypothetical protein
MGSAASQWHANAPVSSLPFDVRLASRLSLDPKLAGARRMISAGRP